MTATLTHHHTNQAGAAAIRDRRVTPRTGARRQSVRSLASLAPLMPPLAGHLEGLPLNPKNQPSSEAPDLEAHLAARGLGGRSFHKAFSLRLASPTLRLAWCSRPRTRLYRRCSCCRNAVSYTHLTLPTICSV
eukprot:8761033-Alexandrium_andersonii.AAC.1